jgi:organic radical activating enzyme
MLRFNNNCDGKKSDLFLNVCFTRNCPHHCIFCCAKNETSPSIPDIEAIADSVLSTGWQHVVIEGGEPLLFPRELRLFIKLIRPHVKDITMFTSLPDAAKSKLDDVIEIFKMLNATNISMLHFDYKKAWNMRGQMGECSDWRNEFIKLIAKSNINFRVSMLLANGYLDSTHDVADALIDFYSLGVKNIKLGEISKSDLFVPFNKVFPSMDFSSPCWNGCSKMQKRPPKDLMLPGLLNNGRTLLLKQVCHLNQRNIVPTSKDNLKLKLRDAKWKAFGHYNYLVILPDGKIEGAWD